VISHQGYGEQIESHIYTHVHIHIIAVKQLQLHLISFYYKCSILTCKSMLHVALLNHNKYVRYPLSENRQPISVEYLVVLEWDELLLAGV